MSLAPPESVQKLRNSLHAKAKGSPGYRFYALYDKVYRTDVLAHAYRCCRANGGAAGVDGQTFEDIEAYGLERWLGELQKELKDKSYSPSAVRRVWIPKPDGKQRPLGVPTIKDRVAQMAAVLVLEAIFEADLQPEQYAYRPERSALDAVSHVQKLLQTGHGQVVDADLSGYFDSIPHADLLKIAGTADQRWCDDAPAEAVAVHGGGRGGRARAEASNDPQSGRGERDAAGRPDLPAAEQPVHAPVRAGVEDVGTPGASEGVHRQLC